MEQTALWSQKWESSKTMTAFIQDVALMQGKRAVVSIKGGTFRRYVCSCTSCDWFVNASRTRRKQRESLGHVTSSCLEHTNRIGVAKPTQRQVAGSTVLRASVVADNSAPAATLAEKLRLQNGVACGKSLVRRAKEEVLKEMYAEDTRSIGLLPSYLRELSAINENLWTEMHQDSNGCFERAVIAMDAQLFVNGQQMFGVDAAHMKHRHYNGVQIILVARDGNMENKIAAVALVPTENTSNYKWFFGVLLAKGYPISSVPVFSDRHLGIVSAAEALNVRVHLCTRHIVGNMRADKAIKLTVSQEGFVWCAQAAKTEAAFSASLNQLAAVNEPAAVYLRSLQPDCWALFPHFKTTPLYGWRTANFVESEQARSLGLKPRKLLPHEYFRAYAKILMGECFKRLHNTAEWRACSRKVTLKAESKLQHEMMKISSYAVAFSSDELCYVSHRSSSLESNVEVNVGAPSCSCAVWMQHGLLCVHLLAAFQAAGKIDKVPTLFAPCYTTAAYSKHLQPLRLPAEEALTVDKSIRPSLLYAQAERPRKRRIRSRGEQRSRNVYRCRQCSSRDGHNIATCRHK